MFCIFCGSKIREGGRYCPMCGSPVDFFSPIPHGATGTPDGSSGDSDKNFLLPDWELEEKLRGLQGDAPSDPPASPPEDFAMCYAPSFRF